MPCSSEKDCACCGRRLEFEDGPKRSSELQLKLFCARREKQMRLFEC